MKKKIWGAYGFLCAVLLLMAASSFLRKRVTYEMGVNLHVTEGEVKEATLGKPLALSRGVYEVTVEYQAEGTENTIFAKSDTRPGKVGSDAILLERGKTEESFQVWVSADVPDVTIRTAYQGYNGFSVSKVTVKESIQGRRRELAQAVLFCLALGIFLRFFGPGGRLDTREKRRTGYQLLVTVFLASIPLLSRGVYIGHDSGFHFLRTEGVWQGLASGQLPVRIQPNWLHGYGYPVSLFYGDALLYVPGVFRMLGFSVQEVYEGYVLAVNGFTAALTFYCLKRILGDVRMASLGSFLYTLSAYRLADVYTRAALGEYSAMAFLPLVLYGFWSIFSDYSGKKNWMALAMGFTGLLETHMLSTEMAAMLAGVLCLVMIRRIFQKETFLALIKAVVLALLLNLWFLIPFLDEMLHEKMNITVGILSGSGIQENGLTVGELFRIWQHGTGIWPNGIQGELPLGIGLAMQLAFLILALTLIVCRRDKEERKLLALNLGFALLTLYGATKYFPWDFLENAGFHFLSTLQFPWRLLGMGTLSLTVGVCAALAYLKKQGRQKLVRLCTGLLVTFTLLGSGYTLFTFMETAEVEECHEERDATYYVSGGEYLPADIELDEEEAFHPLEPRGNGVEIESFQKQYNKIRVTCKNTESEETVLEVPILLYKGYKAWDAETKEEFQMLRTDLGMTGIMLPADYEGTIRMEFLAPLWWNVSEIVSLCAWIGVLVYYMGKKRKRPGSDGSSAPA